jgi:hypothetical protein
MMKHLARYRIRQMYHYKANGTSKHVYEYTWKCIHIHVLKLHRSGEIRCSNGNSEADSSLLGCYIMLACKQLPSHVT